MHEIHATSLPLSENGKSYSAHIKQEIRCEGAKLKLGGKLRCPLWHYL